MAGSTRYWGGLCPLRFQLCPPKANHPLLHHERSAYSYTFPLCRFVKVLPVCIDDRNNRGPHDAWEAASTTPLLSNQLTLSLRILNISRGSQSWQVGLGVWLPSLLLPQTSSIRLIPKLKKGKGDKWTQQPWGK